MLLESYVFNFLKRELEHDVKMSSIVLCCAILSVYIIQFLVKTLIESSKLPPGPGILVKFLLEGHEKHQTFRKLAAKYGSIFSCRLGFQLHIVSFEKEKFFFSFFFIVIKCETYLNAIFR